MESTKLRNLRAMDSMLAEGIRDMRNRIAADMRRIRRDIESYQKAKATREQVRKQLQEGAL
jgi:hypothetical protein